MSNIEKKMYTIQMFGGEDMKINFVICLSKKQAKQVLVK